MFTLLAAGTGAFWLTIPISVLIVAILGIIVVSYRQTIRAYPTGGGSYIVAKENLGTTAGLVAAAALLVDYVLTVSVSVAAGVAAITSAFPAVSGDLRVPLAAASIVAVMVVNLRGIRESGTIFAIPTYVFLVSMLAMIAIGIGRSLLGDVPHVDDVRAVAVPAESLGLLLLMRAFADGCSAITGVEAVSNGVPAFKPPEASHARTTLAIMGVLVGVMFLGISWLAGVVGAVPSEHETVISQIGRAVLGSGVAYYVLQLSTMGILVLAANTSFADFPRLASLLARDGFMPSRFAFRGERLAFSTGIVALAVLSIVVLAAFGGRVEALIPLYAIGVFTSITLSQAGMVVHWRRDRGDGWRRSIAINGTGAVATGIVTVIFAVAKFALGAWLIVIIIPLLVGGMLFIGRQYRRRRLENEVRQESVIGPPRRHQRVIVPGGRRDARRGPGHPLRADDVRRRDRRPCDRRPGSRRADPGALRAPAPGGAAGRGRIALPLAGAAAGPLPRGDGRRQRRRRRRRPPARVRPASLVGTLPLQRERPEDPARLARPFQHPCRGGPIPARGVTLPTERARWAVLQL